MYLMCDIFLLHKYNHVCKCLVSNCFTPDHVLYITTLYNNVTAVCESYFGLICSVQHGLIWFEFEQCALETCPFINMSQPASHQMLNFPTSKLFSTDAISTVDIILNVGLTLDLDTFHLS